MGFSNFCLFPGNFSKLRTVKLFSCEVFLSMKIIEGKNGNSFDGGHPPQHSVKDQTISIFSYEGFLKFLSFCWRLIVKVIESDNHVGFCWFCTSIGVLKIRLGCPELNWLWGNGLILDGCYIKQISVIPPNWTKDFESIWNQI